MAGHPLSVGSSVGGPSGNGSTLPSPRRELLPFPYGAGSSTASSLSPSQTANALGSQAIHRSSSRDGSYSSAKDGRDGQLASAVPQGVDRIHRTSTWTGAVPETRRSRSPGQETNANPSSSSPLWNEAPVAYGPGYIGLKHLEGSGSPSLPVQALAGAPPVSAWSAATGIAVQASTPNRLKYLSLVLLVAQNSAHALTIRYSRTTSGPRYLASTTVVLAEVIKLIICILVIVKENWSPTTRPSAWTGESAGGAAEAWKAVRRLALTSGRTMVPAALYALQNNLIFVALSNLDAATFQVMYQSKIITTALFSVAMLGKSLSITQWIALLFLFQGVVLVQTPSCAEQLAAAVASPTAALAATGEGHRNVFLGLLVVAAISITSGFAGVYFEKILKSAQSTSLFARNYQLSLWGLFFSIVGMLVSDYEALQAGGFFQGYTPVVWLIILIAALGGLLIAVVVKYTDNIAKGFATSISIVLSSVISAAFLHFELTSVFISGAAIVILSVFLYTDPDRLNTVSPVVATSATSPSVLAAKKLLPVTVERS